MATIKQLSAIARTLNELGREYNEREWIELDNTETSRRMTELFAERDKVYANRPSLSQLEYFKDMIKCPMICKHFENELVGVPKRWVEAQKDLMEDYKTLGKMIDQRVKRVQNPYNAECLVEIKGDEGEFVLDYLFENDLISQEVYETALWLEEEAQEACIANIASTHKLEIRIDGRRKFLYKVTPIDIAQFNKEIKKLQMELMKLGARIAKSNTLMDDMANNFSIERLTKTDIADFIERHREEFVSWREERIHQGQIDFLKELDRRMCTQVHSSNMINENGEQIKSGRYMYTHVTAMLKDDTIRLMHREDASKLIKQMERELYDTSLTKFRQEPTQRPDAIERSRMAKKDAEDSKVADDLDTMIGSLYQMCGIDYDYGTGETIATEFNIVKKVDLINMVVEYCGKSNEIFGTVSAITSKIIPQEELSTIWSLI